MARGFAANFRIWLVAFFVVGGFGLVGWKLVDLQVLDRGKYVSYVERLRRTVIEEKGRRGDILDTRGVVLAMSRPLVNVGVDPQVLREGDREKWGRLAELLGMPPAELTKIFERKTKEVAGDDGTKRQVPSRWNVLKNEVDEATYQKILALEVKGVRGDRIYRRAYPHKQLAAHLIGFVNKENTAAEGVEKFADYYLQGKDGWRESEKDGRRNERPEFRTRDVPAVAGFNVHMTIDTVVQHMVEEEIANIVKEFSPEKVTIIVSEPQTGFILALGNYPTFNLNEFNKAPEESRKNVAVESVIEPGSTFKIVAVAGALNEGRVTPETRFDCARTSIEYKGATRQFMKDDHPADHPLSVTEIIAHSSNVGTPQVAMAIGDEKFYEYTRKFGFGEKSGLPFAGESAGIVHPPKKWTAPDITRIPAGYGIGATPVQIHMAMAAIANGGRLLEPQIIRRVKDASGEVFFDAGPNVRGTAVTPQTAAAMAKMLTAVVAEGTGKKADIRDYEVAGKTGTAQKIIDGRYSAKHHVGSFVGFFPASRPRVVISVIVDDGKPANGRPGYGAVVAAPSFERIGRQLIPYLDIKPVDEERATPLRQPALAAGRGAR